MYSEWGDFTHESWSRVASNSFWLFPAFPVAKLLKFPTNLPGGHGQVHNDQKGVRRDIPNTTFIRGIVTPAPMADIRPAK